MNADTFVNYHLILFLFRVCSFFLVTLNVAEPKPYSHFVYRNTSAYERPATESDACNAVNVGLCVCVCCMFEKWLAGLHVVLCSPSLCFLLLLLSSCCQFVFSHSGAFTLCRSETVNWRRDKTRCWQQILTRMRDSRQLWAVAEDCIFFCCFV